MTQRPRLRLPALLRAMRPHQWAKNGFVLAPLAFAGPDLLARGELDQQVLFQVGMAFVAFCMVSSATYLLNDIHDVEADRKHPVKRFRPIAAGEVTERKAWTAFGVLLAVALGAGALAGGWVVPVLAAYFAMNLAYSKGLKRIAYVDAVVIALGFLLRILAGGEAARVHLSAWLVGCTVLLAMYMALGKRKHELLTTEATHRKSLRHYRLSHLNVALTALAAATAVAYLSYTLDADTVARFHTRHLPWTLPFPLFGLWRFSRLIDVKHDAHSPTERILYDVPFLANFALWVVLVLLLIYGVIGGSA